MIKLEVDKTSMKQLNAKFAVMKFLYPEEFFRALVSILFDIKKLAQEKLKADQHIVTGRLRNSLYVKTPGQKFAGKSSNKLSYSYPGGKDKLGRKQPGGSGNRGLDVTVRGLEGAVGTNVVYAKKIEDLDSYLEHAARTVNMERRFKEASKRAEKKLTKKTVSIGTSIIRGLLK